MVAGPKIRQDENKTGCQQGCEERREGVSPPPCPPSGRKDVMRFIDLSCNLLVPFE